MTLILSGTNGLSDVDGDASTPAVRGTDANSGIFFGADTVGVSTGGSEKVSVGASAVVVNDGGADVDFRVEGDTDANLLFVDASTDRVGIGTSSPNNLLTLNTNTSNTAMTVQSSDVGVAAVVFGGQTDFSRGRVKYDNSNDSMSFETNNLVERMRIDSSGRLLIKGTSSTANTFLQVNVDGGNGAEAFMAVMANGSNIANQNAGIYLARTNNLIKSSVDGAGAFRDDIQIIAGGSGGVVLSNGAASWAAISDERKKIIIEPINSALTGLLSWRTVIGRYKTDGEQQRRLFLIAQDVQATHPEAVVVQDVGQESEELLLGYTDTIPVLVAAIKELKAELDTVKAELATLKG